MRITKFLYALWNDDVREHLFEIIGISTGLITFIVLVSHIPSKDIQQVGWVLPTVACLVVSVVLGMITFGASLFTCFVCSRSYEAIVNAWHKSKDE